MNYFQKKLKEQESMEGTLSSTWESLISYRVMMYFSSDNHRSRDFSSLREAKKFAKIVAKRENILCRVFAIYPSSTEQLFEIDGSVPHDKTLGWFSWIMIIFFSLLFSGSAILSVFFP